MPLKKSKQQSSPSLWKAGCDYSETELNEIAQRLAKELKPGDRVLLEGPMGIGKTTFGRFLLQALGIFQPPEGSPTFPIAHEYHSPLGGVVHIDYYRLKSEDEIDEAGIPAYYWERDLIVISEWLSLWPGFEKPVLKSGRIWKIHLSFSNQSNHLRNLEITSEKTIYRKKIK